MKILVPYNPHESYETHMDLMKILGVRYTKQRMPMIFVSSI